MAPQDTTTGPSLEPERSGTEAPAPLRAVHTPNFPALLRRSMGRYYERGCLTPGHGAARSHRRAVVGARTLWDGSPCALARRPHAQLPRAVAPARRVAFGHHLPGRQAGAGPRRGGPP